MNTKNDELKEDVDNLNDELLKAVNKKDVKQFL